MYSRCGSHGYSAMLASEIRGGGNPLRRFLSWTLRKTSHTKIHSKYRVAIPRSLLCFYLKDKQPAHFFVQPSHAESLINNRKMLRRTPTRTWMPAWVPESSVVLSVLLMLCSVVQSCVRNEVSSFVGIYGTDGYRLVATMAPC